MGEPRESEGLDEGDLGPEPMPEVHRWVEAARRADVAEWDAMVVATSTPDGHPSARVVLLRGLDDRGFRFYTNYESRKGAELTANPRAALVLHWREQGRQVRALGTVARLDPASSLDYWQRRPAASRRSAWASRQSAPIGSRAELESAVAAATASLGPDGDAALPPFWGGYLLEPTEVELWQHREDRLHDRVAYLRTDGGWSRTRLQP